MDTADRIPPDHSTAPGIIVKEDDRVVPPDPTPQLPTPNYDVVAADNIVMVNDQGRIEMVNSQAERTFGYGQKELLGETFEILMPDRFRGHLRGLHESFFDNLQPRLTAAGHELNGVKKNGIEFPIEVALSPIQTQDGTMVLATIVDVTDRRRKIAESGYLATIIESSNDAILSKNLAGIITTWNPAAEALFGYTANEIIGRPVSLLLPPDRPKEEDLILKRIKLGERVQHFETFRRRKDGSDVAVSLMISPIRGPDGAIIGASKIARDITESMRSERRITQERDTAQRYLDVAGVMILALDIDANVTLINRYGCAILGYGDPKDIVGKSWIDVFTPERLRSEIWVAFRRLVGGEAAAIEFYTCPVTTSSGEERLIAWHNSILTDASGRVCTTLSSGEDVTERNQVQDKLRSSEERFRSIFSAVSEGIFIVDAESGAFVEVNEPGTEMFGYAANELIGRDTMTISSNISPYTQTEATAWIKKAEATGCTQVFDWQCKAKDGRLFWAEISLQVAVISGRRKVISVIRDVTAHRAVEAQLRQAQKMEAVGQLTGGIAHDFNNLLAIIHGNLELIKEQSVGDPDIEEMAVDALSAAERGASLTHQLLAYSRQQPLAPKVVNLGKLVLDEMKLLTRTLGASIEIKTVMPADLWSTRVDPHQLENALLNLAVNARDAMPGGGKLTIEAANKVLDESYAEQNAEVTPGPYVLLSVTDNGTGMAKAIVDRVLEPFFTTKSVGKGSGLGLSMVFGFVKQSGGHLKIYSELGSGTTINLYLPKALSDAEDWATASDKSAIPRSIEGEVILVLEDEDLVRKFAVRILTGLGYRTIQAADGPAALRLLDEAGRVDLLLTDVALPKGMNGPAVAREAQTRRPGLDVLYMSGYAKDAIIHNGMLADGVHLLTKPFAKTELARMVRQILDDGKR